MILVPSKSRIKFLPNILTSLNVISGSLAIVLALEGEKSLVYASYLVFLSVLLNFLDGLIARLFNAESEFGKHLDTLADVVSLGLAPTTIMYQLLKQALRIKQNLITLPNEQILILLTSFTIIIFTLIRLARFKTRAIGMENMKGLPLSANAMFIAAIPVINAIVPEDFLIYKLLHIYYDVDFPISATIALIGLQIFVFEKSDILIPIFVILSFLMVSGIPMISFKFKNLKYSTNKIRYNFIIFSIILIVICQSIAIPLIVLFYVTTSVLNIITISIGHKRAKKKFDRIFNDAAKINIEYAKTKTN